MNYQKSDPETIRAMFNSIAKRYDRTNAVLSLCMHKRWNKKLVELVRGQSPCATLVDLCAGTGDITLEVLSQLKLPSQAYMIDFCEGMLSCAKEKSKWVRDKGHQIEFIEADVEKVPLSSGIADFATMAYGIRNVKNPAEVIKEAYRILKPGGRFGILELTQPTNSLLRTGHGLYLKIALPVLGKWLTSNQAAYEYLRNSIHTFIAPSEIRRLLINQGFVSTDCYPLAGGIATIITGQKRHL